MANWSKSQIRSLLCSLPWAADATITTVGLLRNELLAGRPVLARNRYASVRPGDRCTRQTSQCPHCFILRNRAAPSAIIAPRTSKLSAPMQSTYYHILPSCASKPSGIPQPKPRRKPPRCPRWPLLSSTKSQRAAKGLVANLIQLEGFLPIIASVPSHMFSDLDLADFWCALDNAEILYSKNRFLTKNGNFETF